MKQINPLYLILLLTVVLFIVLFKQMDAKKRLHETQNSFQKTKTVLSTIVDLNHSWGNKKRTADTLGIILKSSSLRNAKIVRKDKRGIVELHSASIDSKSASYLINRLLNETFTLKSMKIQRLSSQRASLDVEIAL